ncbi:precorrin-3B synthase [Rhodobacter calidifons]|uniref:Precorrin-3B synthase n=1 Tax=Rhodobacter calidifons TaxID=2715277 RepID=A0ABX0G3L6_9RHOB|nr:precorrin-3B synthase [Rhodobacter calidifons]NHB75806.1 precorrin-3B synthase [Rhodobacter calidifons]
MTAWEIKGWCPGALRPMQSGDGLVVRIRPPQGRLTPEQAQAIADAAETHGNGILDLSARANLQLRGVTEASHPRLIDDLRHHGLIDPDIQTESLRNLIVTPFRAPRPGLDPGPLVGPGTLDEGRGPGSSPGRGSLDATATDTLAATLTAALARMPRLPGKFGFALDTGPRPVLTEASADIRVERSRDGRLILRPDGHPLGQPVTDLARDTIAIAEWFVANGGISNGRGRMAALIARGIVPPDCTLAPAEPLPAPAPGLHPDGALVALAFGQMQAATLRALAALGHKIRPTPWRMLLIVGATTLPKIAGLIIDPADPMLRITACTGAPACPQARGDTRQLARQIAPHLAPGQSLHLSGCAKGCAHPGPAPLTLTATDKGYVLIRHGTAHDTPSLTGLSPQAILNHLKALHAPPL